MWGCDPRGLITHHYAVALAGIGEWDTAAKVALARPRPIDGPSLTVILADRARQGDLTTVARAAGEYAQKDPDLLRKVAKLLRLGGETQAAQKVLSIKPAAAQP